VKRGEADGLVIVKLDRPTRSVADWQSLIDGYFGEQLMSVSDMMTELRRAGATYRAIAAELNGGSSRRNRTHRDDSPPVVRQSVTPIAISSRKGLVRRKAYFKDRAGVGRLGDISNDQARIFTVQVRHR
jgi:hypothetical protein